MWGLWRWWEAQATGVGLGRCAGVTVDRVVAVAVVWWEAQAAGPVPTKGSWTRGWFGGRGGECEAQAAPAPMLLEVQNCSLDSLRLFR